MAFFSRLKEKVKEVASKVTGGIKTAAKKVTSGVKKTVSTVRAKEKELRTTETKRREEAGETKLDVIKKRAFPKEDPVRDIALAVLPVGRAGKALNEGLKIGATTGKSFKGFGNVISNLKSVKIAAGRTLTKTTFGKAQVNTKTAALSINMVSKFFSPKAMLFYAGWAGSIGMNLWAQAEAPEGIMFPVTKFLIPEAERTGDWSAVDEALAMADEVTDLGTWEKILGVTPFALIPGALNKLKGNIAGKEVMKKYTADQKVKQETGQSEADYWKERRVEEIEDDKAAINYYNEQRKLMVEWEREATVDARNADAKFWRKEKEKQAKKEAEDREAIAKFWLAYRKEAQKIAENNRPSNLNFGLL